MNFIFLLLKKAVTTDALWYSGWFLLTKKYESCKNYINTRLNSSLIEKTIYTPQCFYLPETPFWEGDACCNINYTWSDKCCHLRYVSVALDTFNNTKSTAIQDCSSNYTENLLTEYINLINIALDPEKGFFFFSSIYSFFLNFSF